MFGTGKHRVGYCGWCKHRPKDNLPAAAKDTTPYMNAATIRRIMAQVNASVAHMDISEEVARARESEDERMRPAGDGLR